MLDRSRYTFRSTQNPSDEPLPDFRPLPSDGETKPIPPPFSYHPVDMRPDPFYDQEGLDRTNDLLTPPPRWQTEQASRYHEAGIEPTTPGIPPRLDQMQRAPLQEQRFDPRDTNRNGIVEEIEKWQSDMQKSKEVREQEWIEQQLFPKGFSADKVTREIYDPHGRVVGRLPDF